MNPLAVVYVSLFVMLLLALAYAALDAIYVLSRILDGLPQGRLESNQAYRRRLIRTFVLLAVFLCMLALPFLIGGQP